MSNNHLLNKVATVPSSADKLSEPIHRELLAHICAGDHSALGKLYVLYFGRLAIFFVHMTENVDLVEELISDTMLNVWQQCASVGPHSSVSVWIMGLAYLHGQKRLAAGWSTRQHVRPSVFHAKHANPVSSTSPTLEMLSRSHNFLLRLPVDERMALYLAYACDHSQQEIAYIMNVSCECVGVRVASARLRLRSYFAL